MTKCTGVVDPQAVLAKFVARITFGSGGLAQYTASDVRKANQTVGAVALGETNSAACSGIPGLSNSFVAALWTVDSTLAAAYRGFCPSHGIYPSDASSSCQLPSVARQLVRGVQTVE